MPERVVGLGEVVAHLPSDPWVLVFGVSREGNRRARRAIRAAVDSNMTVLWFDGFGERWEGGRTGRVDLDFPVPEGSVVVVDYSDDEKRHWLNRMVERVPVSVIGPIERAEGVGKSGDGRVRTLTSIRRGLQRGLAVFQKMILRRIAQIFRGIASWRLVSDDVELLSISAPPPRMIIYGDDFALTQGWWAARAWPETPTAMEMNMP